MEAIAHSGTVLAVLSKEGVVIVGIKLTSDQLLESTNEKVIQINSDICCAITGILISLF